jgi:hypothetical protein
MIDEDDWEIDRPPSPPKYKNGQLVVAQVYEKGYCRRIERVCEIKFHMICGTGMTSDKNGTTYTPPTYMYSMIGVEDGEDYTAEEEDIGRYVPSVPPNWEPKESR